MRIDFSQEIRDVYGVPLMRVSIGEDGTRGPDLKITLGWLCVQALMFDASSPAANPNFGNVVGIRDSSFEARMKPIDALEKVVRLNLALMVCKDKEVELEKSDVEKIRTLVGLYCPTIAAGRAIEMLCIIDSAEELKA